MIFRKGRSELKEMCKANLILASVLDHLATLVRPGVSTKELDSEAEEMIRSAGGIPAFKGSVSYTHLTLPTN